MLVDVRFNGVPNPILVTISQMNQRRHGTSRISEGLYECSHWSFELEVAGKLETYPNFSSFDSPLSCYGVCDYPAQLIEKFPFLKTSDCTHRFVVAFVRIERSEQPLEGGWRWHKWGEYIGDKKPQNEYLCDEKDIDQVYTYHIYEVPPSPL